MTGHEMYQNTELGKALSSILPEMVSRIVIDIRPDEIIKIYYETAASEKLLNSDWLQVVKESEIIMPPEKKTQGQSAADKDIIAEKDRQIAEQKKIIEELNYGLKRIQSQLIRD
jgi:hypothetical protein